MLVQLGGVGEGFVAKLASLPEFLIVTIVPWLGLCVVVRLRRLVAQHHLHNTAPLPLVAPVVVAMNDPHVTYVTLLMHQHLTTLLARISRTLRTVVGQMGGQIANRRLLGRPGGSDLAVRREFSI